MFSDRNIGRIIILAKSKKEDVISSVIKSKLRFRIKSEENGPVVSDYMLSDIAQATCLTVSFDNGKTWQDIAIDYNKEDSAEEYLAIKDKKEKV